MELLTILKQFWLPAVIAFVMTLVLILLALKVFPKIGLMDRPKRYGLKRAPIPYYGGVVIYIVFVTVVLLFVPITKTVIGLLIACSMIAVLGFIDDLFNIPPLLRLFFQFLSGLVLVTFGVGILSINLPLIGVIDLSLEFGGVMLFSGFFTIIWVMTILNFMNFIDGVPGLSSGVSFIAALTIFLLSILLGVHEDPSSQIAVGMIALIVAMCSLAFLFFDFPKPKILMGDTGSTFLGFTIATLAIFSGGKVATAFLVLGIPILDAVWVILRRYFTGKSIFKGDMKHLHHRLLDLGMSKRVVVLLYLLITAIFGFMAVMFVNTQQKLFMVIALVMLMVLLAGALVLIPRKR